MVAIAALASGDAGAFEKTWHAGLLLFGASLVVVGWLTVRCTWLPSWLGVLVIIAGAGYGLDSIVATLVLRPRHRGQRDHLHRRGAPGGLAGDAVAAEPTPVVPSGHVLTDARVLPGTLTRATPTPKAIHQRRARPEADPASTTSPVRDPSHLHPLTLVVDRLRLPRRIRVGRQRGQGCRLVT